MISWTVSSPLIVANSSERVLTPRSVVDSSCVRRSLTLSWSSLSRVMASTIWAPLGDSGVGSATVAGAPSPTRRGRLDTDDLVDRPKVGEDDGIPPTGIVKEGRGRDDQAVMRPVRAEARR